ncbi:MAG: hypothetical protein ACE5GX_13235 [Thermoanaerobaculia bacterium]
MTAAERGLALGAVLARVARFAVERGLTFYVVGGFVRDRFLGEDAADLDLVWIGDGDPERVSTELGERFESPVSYRGEFLTASLAVDGFAVDFGRARVETYEAPAALPAVRPGSLEQDLLRRDFSVNAMAWPVSCGPDPDAAAEDLVDPCGGYRDLAERSLRVMHPRSFADDPTRILRGIELKVRRGFEFEPDTLGLARAALAAGHLELVSGARLRRELARLLATARRAASSVPALRDLGIDRALGFQIDDARVSRFRDLCERASGLRADLGSVPTWVLVLGLLVSDWSPAATDTLAERLQLDRSAQRFLTGGSGRARQGLAALSAVDWDPMEVARDCSGLSEAELALIELQAPESLGPRWLRLKELLSVSLVIDGDDLIGAGAAPGARIGRALERTLDARRSGEIGPERELEFALGWLAEPESG